MRMFALTRFPTGSWAAMNTPFYETAQWVARRLRPVMIVFVLILLSGQTPAARAALLVDELVAGGSDQSTATGIRHYGIVGQSTPIGLSTSSSGNRLFAGKFITSIGIGAYSELDADNDGTPDMIDALPDDPAETSDNDGDGVGDNADTDDDNDGISDDADLFPYDPAESGDNDGDGIGDNADTDDDNDGVSDAVENAHPDGGDGNNDTLADSLQENVASLLTYDGLNYVVLESPAGTRLSHCQAVDNPSTADSPAGIEFTYGFFNFTINGVDPGGTTTLMIYFPADAVIDTYYKYGRTPDDPTDHWYEFMYDGETGAEIDDLSNIATLHFVDAKTGDDILTEDSLVIDLGGPGTRTASGASSGGSGSSGCFVGSVLP